MGILMVIIIVKFDKKLKKAKFGCFGNNEACLIVCNKIQV